MEEQLISTYHAEPNTVGFAPWLQGVPNSAQAIEKLLGPATSAGELGRVLATVLFTDIVDATGKVAELGDRRWHALLDKHHALVRRALEGFRGHEIDTAGDGFFAVFDAPARAIRCACTISEAVRTLGIVVRAGLHAGECEVMADKIGGLVVHIGARVATCAEAGEVLVSSTVKDLVVGCGFSFVDRGLRTLRGVPGEWRLYAVDRDIAAEV